jgi:hypothetical protein
LLPQRGPVQHVAGAPQHLALLCQLSRHAIKLMLLCGQLRFACCFGCRSRCLLALHQAPFTIQKVRQHVGTQGLCMLV